jgi:hypothetical protein
MFRWRDELSPIRHAYNLRMRALLMFLAISTQLASQTPLQEPATQSGELQVEVSTDKTHYTVGESIRFKALLSNRGPSAVYVAKSFFSAGGGIAGFWVSVDQLKGKRSGLGCVSAGDRFPMKDPRAPEQILQEDFLRLPPGGIVGYEDQYRGCVVKNSGTYQITATYCACDLNSGKARSAEQSVFIGKINSKPTKFRVRRRHRSCFTNRREVLTRRPRVTSPAPDS